MHNATGGLPEAKVCVWCDGTNDTAANPLVVLASGGAEEEFIHLHCARTNIQFGFCWCCRESKVFYSEDLNEAGECEIHDGESVPDYPDEDAESYIENVRNNEGS
ncbi:hypothetical protein WJ96_06850 [Burkholderia ubonensis]|uniref:Uncharacterized protein n=1 Tax=Burkholderia ubonensis TaxID=101571 RepID=A0AAW3MZ16_9BURK|nr:hypothetical protein [Burkholderia ubonensis]KVP75422.1 hypothetical protein WJ93_08645 [Burkholderia ubonensis]KVP98235.1 hypothetical protein WJ96_06850 [Burkholderia ubonensis]KVZ92932.1 hypothetical protein WL25_18510 [Burkholderia ubonensis]